MPRLALRPVLWCARLWARSVWCLAGAADGSLRRPHLSPPSGRATALSIAGAAAFAAALVLGGGTGTPAVRSQPAELAAHPRIILPPAPTVEPSVEPPPTVYRVAVPGSASDGQLPTPTPVAASQAQVVEPEIPATSLDARFRMPLAHWSRVTDRYGAVRAEGVIHAGIDLVVDGVSGSPITSACEGEVSAVGSGGEYGTYVVVDCGDGWSTTYAHLGRVSVRWGQGVGFSTVIGTTGTTGFTTGEHLHFEIRRDGRAVDPEHYLDFGIPAGTPRSSGPIILTPTPEPSPTPEATATPAPPTATPTPAPPTPTPTPTLVIRPWPTATPTPPPATSMPDADDTPAPPPPTPTVEANSPEAATPTPPPPTDAEPEPEPE